MSSRLRVVATVVALMGHDRREDEDCAGDGGDGQREVEGHAEENRHAAPADDRVDHANHAGGGGEELPARAPPEAHVGQHPGYVVAASHHEIAPLATRELEVVVADAIDRAPVQEVLDRALYQAHEG